MAELQQPNAAAFRAALDDPQIEQRVRAIVEQSLADYEWIMSWGTESERMALLKTAVPGLLRAMAARDKDTRLEEQRRIYQKLRTAFQQNIHQNTLNHDDDD